MEEIKFWVALSRVSLLGTVRFRRLEAFFCNLQKAWEASPGELRAAGIEARATKEILATRSHISPDAEVERLTKEGIEAINWHHADYPPRLKEIADPPPVLYYKGALLPSDERSVAVVGTRLPASYGKEAAAALTTDLARNGITIVSGLAQGIDGAPHRVMRRFVDNPSSVLLGTNSLWEGVDLPSGVLKVLVLTRLPFNVPTNPIFAARGEQYEDSFRQFAVPQAVLRFRQGFGRLIRNTQDRGVVLVMDRRILSKSYGRAFLNSLPDCTLKIGPMASMREYVRQWW